VLHRFTEDLSRISDEPQWLQVAEATEDAAVKALQETKPEHRLYTNVEFYTATTLYYVGIPIDYYATMFACSRIAGWSAHVMDQFRDNRLIRPRAEYVGPRDRTYIPLQERALEAAS
jgi:citrate synthase